MKMVSHGLKAGLFGAAFTAISVFGSAGARAEGSAPADTVYLNGTIYTADNKDSVAGALAVREGRIVFVGSGGDAKPHIGPQTKVIDLGGRMAMPGLIDGHMHPLGGGKSLTGCNLAYAALTLEQTLAAIQACLDQETKAGDDDFLIVNNWFRQKMLPAGTDMAHGELDKLKTKRPILVINFDYHSKLANSRALSLAKVSKDTPDPKDGKIVRDAAGEPTGMLEDGGDALVMAAMPKLSPEQEAEQNLAFGRTALDALRKGGITSFLEAAAEPGEMNAWATLQKRGELTARAHLAPKIATDTDQTAEALVKTVSDYAARFDQGPLRPEPGITLRNAKIFMDGVIQAPAQTGYTLAPYFVNKGNADKPDWQPGTVSGSLYVAPDRLSPLLIGLAEAGIDPHLHTDGDGAVHVTLNAIEAMRAKVPGKDIRPALAHNEMVDPADLPRFAKLGAIPVLSFQWGAASPDQVASIKEQAGPKRLPFVEPYGQIYKAGARVAFGSDWPVDPLNEWYAFQIAVTRSDPSNPGRLNADPGLTIGQALRAATIDAAYELHQDEVTGSLEPGKFADLIVLDRNPLKIAPEEVSKTKVLLTVVGGKEVHRAEEFK
ncbi:amidohydrolase [Labrys sp. KB_33_2]|uniref:amidohydrolase n=1 Tax=Labrys sp. KB_33_2 TaxID=3237479 RepID=UPI003F8EB07F